MKVLLIEDNDSKIADITSFLGNRKDIEVVVKKNLLDSVAELKIKYDLIIFDIFLPFRDGEPEHDCSEDIVSQFSSSPNVYTEALALTKFKSEDISNIDKFNLYGITVVTYSEHEHEWKTSLNLKINRASGRNTYDFLVFCALQKERSAYSKTEATLGDMSVLFGINSQEIRVGKHRGLCLIPGKMGLVSMAIMAAKAIELFQPKIVAMSGICAGVPGESNLLDLVIGSLCWEYQTGKYKNGSFIQEPYQCGLESDLDAALSQLAENQELLLEMKKGLFDSELKNSKIVLRPVSSGSAVIADDVRMKEICGQHRKMAALEMEMYALYQAAFESVCKPIYFGVKSVVDMGDNTKGDSLHTTACILSARCVINILKMRLN